MLYITGFVFCRIPLFIRVFVNKGKHLNLYFILAIIVYGFFLLTSCDITKIMSICSGLNIFYAFVSGYMDCPCRVR